MSEMDVYAASDELLGRCGRQLSGAKQAPDAMRVIWNANVCTKEHGKVWFGDISLRDSADKLRELARLVEAKVYVLREHDARFENEESPLLDRAVEVIEP